MTRLPEPAGGVVAADVPVTAEQGNAKGGALIAAGEGPLPAEEAQSHEGPAPAKAPGGHAGGCCGGGSGGHAGHGSGMGFGHMLHMLPMAAIFLVPVIGWRWTLIAAAVLVVLVVLRQRASSSAAGSDAGEPSER